MKINRCRSRLLIFLILIIVFFASTISASALEVKKEVLPNGLKVIYVERHNLPIVIVNLTIKASSLDEDDKKAGTAYLTSTMLREGTKKRTSSEISDEIEFLGASLSSSVNSDYTSLSLSILKKDIEKGFELFSDVLLHPTFPEDELKRKKELLRGSLKQKEQDPSFVASKEFIKEVYGDHPYGRLLTGTPETIENIQRQDIINFYNSYYTPDNAFLVVAGDITKEELDGLIKKYLYEWQTKRKGVAQKKALEVNKTKKIKVIDKDVSQANIIFGHIGVSRDNPDYYAITVMNYILGGGGLTSRLMKTIREEMGLTYSIYSSFTANMESGHFEIEVQTKNENASTVIKEIINHIEKIKKEPVSEQELEDAKSFLIGSFPRRLETTKRVTEFLSAVEFYNLGDDYMEKYPKYIQNVTLEDVLRVAKKYLNTDNFVLVVVGNKKNLRLPDL